MTIAPESACYHRAVTPCGRAARPLFTIWVLILLFAAAPSALAQSASFDDLLTEPVLGFFRRYIPPVGGLDLSPIVIFLILAVIRGQIGC
jgi:YggT family protein